MVENVWEEKEITRIFLFRFYMAEWCPDNCPRGLGLGVGLVLGLGSNFPWGQLSQNRQSNIQHKDIVINLLICLLSLLHMKILFS